MVEGEFEQGVTSLKVQLQADVGAMIIDSAGAEIQLTRDLLAGLVLGDQFENATLHRGELGEARLLLRERAGACAPVDEVGGDRRAEVVSSGSHGPDAADNLGDGAVFEHVPFDSQIQRSVKGVSSLYIVRKINPTGRFFSRTACATSNPFRLGIPMSRTATSGL